MKKIFSILTPFEICLWILSAVAIVISYITMPGDNLLPLFASLIGITALIFVARGNVIGQVLIIVFAAFYGVISYFQTYYGEMITYLGMSAPIAVVALVAWIRNPYGDGKVKVARLKPWQVAVLLAVTAAVTVAFYFILDALGNANLAVSTVSVATSFMAASLTVLRSPFYALSYAANDVVLIVLWAMAIENDPSAASMIVCFATFLINDLYGFINWLRMQKHQSKNA